MLLRGLRRVKISSRAPKNLTQKWDYKKYVPWARVVGKKEAAKYQERKASSMLGIQRSARVGKSPGGNEVVVYIQLSEFQLSADYAGDWVATGKEFGWTH